MRIRSSRKQPRCFRTFRVAATLIVGAQLTGCVSTAYYPDHWAEKVNAGRGACPDIAGEYLNEGESFVKVADGGVVRHTVPLGSLACTACTDSERSAPGSFALLTEAYERFRLELTDKILTITSTTADGITYSHQRPIRARCSGSMLEIEAGWLSSLEEEGGWEMFGTTFGMSMLERTSLKLGRAEDGALLVRHLEVASLMVLQWPITPMTSSAWIRFPAATPRPELDEPPVPPAVQPQLQAGMPP